MKTDARTRYTLSVIKRSFLELLKGKSIEKITVREICTRAEINRTTFYRHYDDQYDLLDSLQRDILDKIKGEIDLRHPSPDELCRLMFELIYENRGEWLVLMGDNADPRITGKITRFISDYFKVSEKSDSGKMKYHFILSGAAGLFDYWTKSGMKEPPERMAEYVNSYNRALNQG